MSRFSKLSLVALCLAGLHAWTQAQGNPTQVQICGGPAVTYLIPGASAQGSGATLAEAQLNGQAQLIAGFEAFGNSKCPNCPYPGPPDCGGGNITLVPLQSPSYGTPTYNPILQLWTVTVYINAGGIRIKCKACPGGSEV